MLRLSSGHLTSIGPFGGQPRERCGDARWRPDSRVQSASGLHGGIHHRGRDHRGKLGFERDRPFSRFDTRLAARAAGANGVRHRQLLVHQHRGRLRIVESHATHCASSHARSRVHSPQRHRCVMRVRLVPSADNIADFFTKVLEKFPFQKHRRVIMNLVARSAGRAGQLVAAYAGKG